MELQNTFEQARDIAREYGEAVLAYSQTMVSLGVIMTTACFYNKQTGWRAARDAEEAAQDYYDSLPNNTPEEKKARLEAHDNAQAAWRLRFSLEDPDKPDDPNEV